MSLHPFRSLGEDTQYFRATHRVADERERLRPKLIGEVEHILRDLIEAVVTLFREPRTIPAVVSKDVGEGLRVEVVGKDAPTIRRAKPAMQTEDGMGAGAHRAVRDAHGLAPG